eukprot:CAMPEP_0202714614 /NCGR_PEP_ID=MMETSP1385-20130828/76818_1 /ASSEMBLY_ACC=CAM_ASM_000861 /TAXON_ID=933848 /ORGANISM="Elphidium margaritaceum" /LENGTH=60 /DNA_ID=CAMNT_0049375487 /DNA_START=103 /DNA_END=282 /DNA_ORIENTATION=-
MKSMELASPRNTTLTTTRSQDVLRLDTMTTRLRCRHALSPTASVTPTAEFYGGSSGGGGG